jgi:hypothetical protein
MKLLIRTPWINDNKYIPHILEHCILQSNNINDFINIQIPIYASTATWYTEFEFDKKHLNSLLQKLETPIKKESFSLEQKIIKKELKQASFGQKLYIDTLRKISWNKKLISNSIQNWIKFEDILKYQKKYYKKENMILVDDKNELINIGWMEKSIILDPKIKLESEIKYKNTKFQWENYDNIYTEYKTPYDIIILDFFCDFINDYTYYIDTKRWKYWYDYSDISITDKYMILNFDKWYLPKKINNEFFEYYKKTYINDIKEWENRTYIPIIALFTWYYVSKKQHAKFIENINIKNILQQNIKS